VTIGLCVKNVEQTIEEVLNSILEQDFPHELIELIVVDGCSNDKTLLIIEVKLSKADIKHKIFRENSGLGWARQIVVDNACGEYIVWVDGDILLLRDHVKKQVEFMEQNPNAGIGVGKHMMYNETSLVATMENIEDAIEFKLGGEVRSKILGTGGSIYRVKAIKDIGGFDEHIRGSCEDMDAEYRVRAAGWGLYVTPATFSELRRKTWKTLWDEYFWHGYGGHCILHKNVGLINRYKMFPPIAILTEIVRSSIAYKLTHRKVMFLLPLHYTFKRIAWCMGFVKSHLGGYGHI